jgi:membrane-bound inhibitor of C-type lysozyme
MRSTTTLRRAAVVLALGVLAACAPPEKPADVPSKDTFECTLEGERWVIRFTDGEARLLTPGSERITLYQIAAASGVRYSNGLMELRGKGMELQLIRDGFARQLDGCKPVMVPQETPSAFPWLNPPSPPK